MKTSIPVSADIVALLARIIGMCDFRTTISRYASIENSPWIITVGESRWQRHLVVEEVTVGTDGQLEAYFSILPSSESLRMGYDIRTDKPVLRRVPLKKLIAETYVSVKRILSSAA